MGKTLVRVLSVTAAIGVNLIPGVGQLLSLAFAAVTAYGVQSAAGLLGLGPSAPKPQTSESAIKSPRPERVSAYGYRRGYASVIVQ